MPVEPVVEIGRHSMFYTDKLPDPVRKTGLKSLSFAPVVEGIKLVKGKITSLLCERNLYKTGFDGEKSLFARANVFCESLNRCLWLGFTFS
jgi:hypothetical protein